MGTALLILVLLALCGFIAYIGDLLGRRLGKKRLSVFGLRPKHTAILLTIVTGVLIAGVTFAAALVSIPMFRTVVTQGERLARANRELSREYGELERRNQDAAQENQRLTTESGRLREEMQGLATRNTDLAKKNTELTGKNGELAGRNEQLQADNGKLLTLNNDLRGNNTRLRTTNAGLTGENSRLRTRQARLRGEQARLAKEVRSLRRETGDLKAGRYVYERGLQIRYRPVPANAEEDLLRQAVRTFLYEVEYTVVTEASARQGNRAQVALVAPSGDAEHTATPAELENWLVRKARPIRAQPLVMRAVASENTVEGRPVRVRVDVYPNTRVFGKAEVIADTRVDGGASRGTVLESLIAFLKTTVGPKALDRGMFPDQNALGEKTYDELLDTCDRIRQTHGFVRVTARARQDTYRAGPLNVDLEVSPVGGSQAKSR